LKGGSTRCAGAKGEHSPKEFRRRRTQAGWLLLITCFALTFDWVAFGPGARKFSGSIVGIGFYP
jgi:hypothetical protein